MLIDYWSVYDTIVTFLDWLTQQNPLIVWTLLGTMFTFELMFAGAFLLELIRGVPDEEPEK